MKNMKNELYKIRKSNRFMILSVITASISIFTGVILRLVEEQGSLPEDTIAQVIGGAFPLQVLSVISDMILPIFATILVTFLLVDEYNNGTLKLPLLCGQNRYVVLISKILAVSFTMLVLVLISYISATLTGMVLWGKDELLATVIPNFIVFMETYLAMVSWTVIMFLLGMFIHNSGTMIGLVAVILVAANIVNSLFPAISKMSVLYYFKAFASMKEVSSIVFGIGICLETIIIFGMFAFGRFNQMEISK